MRWTCLLLFAACANHEATPTVTKVLSVDNEVDVLLVIDNSLSMTQMQSMFAASMPSFVASLQSQFGGVANVHVGVVSTTVGFGVSSPITGGNCPQVAPNDDGKLHNELVGADSGGTIDGVTCGDCSTTSAYLTAASYTCPVSEPLEVPLGCTVEMGTSGCGFEEPLEAMKLALDGSQAANAGFVRDDAYLAVLIVTNQDDCSVANPAFFQLDLSQVGGASDFRCAMYAYECDQPITASQADATYTGCKPRAGSDSPYLQDTSFYSDFLGQTKDPSRLIVGVVSGPSSSTINTGSFVIPGQTIAQDPAVMASCEANIDGNPFAARPGLRLADFVTRLGDRGSYYSACQADYSASLVDFTTRVAEAMSPCLEGAIDPTTCTVEFVQGDAHERASGWSLESNPTLCADTTMFPSQLELKFADGAGPPQGWLTSVTCARASP